MKTKVSIVRTRDRASAIPMALDLLGVNPVSGRDVLLKPNLNTADPYPASTHNDTLRYLVLKLREMGCGRISIGERSGPADTGEVIKEKGVDTLAEEMNLGIINFEELPREDWVRVNPARSHWRKGFLVARPVLDAGCIVATCCLKTHGYGGAFTMSLKLGVGITHKGNMTELHTSFMNMKNMIAEINQAYSPALIVMDGLEVFTDGGPMSGERKQGDAIVAGTDRVAVDAVGLAILKILGSNPAIMKKRIFEQEQIARAVELGLGAKSPEDIELVTAEPESAAYAEMITSVLAEG